MFLGRFAMGVATKPFAPKLPMWALFLAPQLMDLLFLPLVALGVEGYEPGPYGHDVLNATYTHSLVGALVIALGAFALGRGIWRSTTNGAILAGLSFSHWVVDLFVHHHDMPLLPGNLGGFPMLGFGLWDFEYAVFSLEVLMALTSVVLYFRWARREAGPRWFIGPLVIGAIFSLMILGDIPRLPPL